MELNLTRSQKEIQKAATTFAKGEFDKNLALNLDKEGKFPEEIWKKAAELGLIGIHIDGDNKLSLVDSVIVAQSLCAVDSGIGSSILSTTNGAELLFMDGDENFRAKYLEPLLTGDKICSLAYLESEKNLQSTNTRAYLQDGVVTLSGSKIYVINADAADYFIILCLISLKEEPSENLSLIVVDKNTDGINIRSLGEKLGFRMNPVANVDFSEAKIPAANILTFNCESKLKKYLAIDRILKASVAIGIAKGAFTRALEYTKLRKQFGKAIAGFQVTKHKFADMDTQIQSANLLTFQAAQNIENANFDELPSAQALLTASKAAVYVCDEAVQLMGGYGYMAEYDVERFYRDAKALEITYPSSSALKDIIASKVIGKVK